MNLCSLACSFKKNYTLELHSAELHLKLISLFSIKLFASKITPLNASKAYDFYHFQKAVIEKTWFLLVQ